ASGMIALRPWLRSANESADPLVSVSNNSLVSTPERLAMTYASDKALTVSKITMLLRIFVTWPAPVAPQLVTSLAKQRITGSTIANGFGVAPTITLSVPAIAASRVRAIGASA